MNGFEHRNVAQFKEKENQNKVPDEHKHVVKVKINVNAMVSPKKMENQMCAPEDEAVNKRRICLVGAVASDEEIKSVASTFDVPVVTSETGIEFAKQSDWITYFVMNEFEGEPYYLISKSKQPIYGPTALKQLAQSGNGLVCMKRPRYNFAMKGLVTSFSGIRKKDELTRLVNLILSMGGSIRKDVKDNHSCTHLICNSSVGEKHYYAKTFKLNVVRPAWVLEAWERRNDCEFFANDNAFTEKHKLKPFEGLCICFYGFSAEEQQEMVDILKANGGIPTEMDDPECSHLVLANGVTQLPELVSGRKSPVVIPQTPALPPPSTTRQLDSVPRVNSVNDGAVLNENIFLEPANLSPILHNIDEKDEHDGKTNEPIDKNKSKRKRDSFDNISIISTETFAAQYSSAKKPKLVRTGSITRSLSRSMSFAGMKNPIKNLFRTRRDSIDANASINSITSMESTFIGSIKRPVKDKILRIKDRIANSSRLKREFCLTPKTSRKLNSTVLDQTEMDDDKFAYPHEISMLSCRKLVNSTMNATTIAEALEPDVLESQTVPRDEHRFGRVYRNEPIKSSDVTDNPTAGPGSILAPPNSQPDHPKSNIAHILKSDWFWYTIQKGVANEDDYRFDECADTNTANKDRPDSLHPGKKHLKGKRISLLGVSDAALSVSGSFLDFTNSPSGKHDSKGKGILLNYSFLSQMSHFHYPNYTFLIN